MSDPVARVSLSHTWNVHGSHCERCGVTAREQAAKALCPYRDPVVRITKADLAAMKILRELLAAEHTKWTTEARKQIEELPITTASTGRAPFDFLRRDDVLALPCLQPSSDSEGT
jgi:hypothetical protein